MPINIDISEINHFYNEWRNSLMKMDALLNDMESRIEKTENPFIKQQLQRNYEIVETNYNLQIDLINCVYTYVNEHTIPKSIHLSQKELLQKCKLYINALGGDFSNVKWMQKSDFKWR
jgi:ATP-dependent protease ClpP protease subunit